MYSVMRGGCLSEGSAEKKVCVLQRVGRVVGEYVIKDSLVISIF